MEWFPQQHNNVYCSSHTAKDDLILSWFQLHFAKKPELVKSHACQWMWRGPQKNRSLFSAQPVCAECREEMLCHENMVLFSKQSVISPPGLVSRHEGGVKGTNANSAATAKNLPSAPLFKTAMIMTSPAGIRGVIVVLTCDYSVCPVSEELWQRSQCCSSEVGFCWHKFVFKMWQECHLLSNEGYQQSEGAVAFLPVF